MFNRVTVQVLNQFTEINSLNSFTEINQTSKGMLYYYCNYYYYYTPNLMLFNKAALQMKFCKNKVSVLPRICHFIDK